MTPIKRTIKSGTHLFRENDRSRELYIIQTGSVRIYRTAAGKEIELANLGQGSVLGEMALIDGKPRSASAKACEDCSVVLIDAETFHEKIKGVPPWFISIIRMTSSKIRRANQRLKNSSRDNEQARIILALHLYFRRYHAAPVELQTIQHGLIQLLGVTLISVHAALDQLLATNFIEIAGTRVRVTDNDRFDEYCDYLRLVVRKQIDPANLPSNILTAAASRLVAGFPAIMRSPVDTSTIERSAFIRAVQTTDWQDAVTDPLYLLETAKVCSVQRGANGDSTGSGEEAAITINHAICRRLHLAGTYSPLVSGANP